jgi:hypothetical protein
MVDFYTQEISQQCAGLVDAGLLARRAIEPDRTYLGASRLGVSCERALQFEFMKVPVDPGRELSGRLLRIFERGHVMEDVFAGWLRLAGFDLHTHDGEGEQFGFSALDGLLQGHIDGVFLDGPAGISYPALWEMKCLGKRGFMEVSSSGLAVARPEYAAQVAVYQAYMDLYEYPAVFTVLNVDSMEIYTELIPFDAALAQKMSDRAVKIITATRSKELLPRGFAMADHFKCRMCAWQKRCWEGI